MSEAKKEVQTVVNTTPAEETVQVALEKMKPQFAAALPKHITPDRMLRVALTAIQNTPALLTCNRKSLLLSILRAAQLGLEPDGILGQAYLIPFKKNWKDESGKWQSRTDAQLIPGYRGLIDLARRSGEVSNIIAKEVYSKDEFSVDWSQQPPFTHKPAMTGDRGEITHFWALANFKDGGYHWDYMTKGEVDYIRQNSNGAKNEVWDKYYAEMGKKTMIRRIAKYLPMNVQKAAMTEELLDANKSFTIDNYGEIILDHDDTNEGGMVIDNEPPKKGNAALKEKLADKKEKAKEAGADPETGELQQKENEQKVSEENPNVKKLSPEAKAEAEKVIAANADPDASTKTPMKAIPLYPVEGNASSTDFERWKLDFMKGCNGADSLKEILAFHNVNIKVLTQIKTRAPVFYEQCERCYTDNCERLKSAQ